MKNEEKRLRELILRLEREHRLTEDEYLFLIENRSKRSAELLRKKALKAKRSVFGKSVYLRALIEISNICKNDCYYCGIRCSNRSLERYRLTEGEILELVREGYALGFKTFVLQGGEDGYYTDDRLVALIKEIKRAAPDAALTLSLGERDGESYERLKKAGADRYLLRHESINPKHYASLHPENMKYENRLDCLKTLRRLGYQVGSGFMVGSPGQTARELAKEMKFIEEFKPDMCGIGPFIPHSMTPFKNEKAGDVELTLYLLSIIRLIDASILLPATTALGSLNKDGRERGIRSGANVVMPNLSPKEKRGQYQIYEGKITSGVECAESLELLKKSIRKTGMRAVMVRGDNPKFQRN